MMKMRGTKAHRHEGTKGPQQFSAPLRASVPPCLRAFSFTEIMFAVIILGIGFIMVAAIFPVAIQQAKNNTEETSAAALARGAANYLDQIFADGPNKTGAQNTSSNAFPSSVANDPGIVKQTTPTMPGVVQQPSHLIPDQAIAVNSATLWKAAAGNLVLSEDPRKGFVFLYRRQGQWNDPNTWSPYAQVYIFPVQATASAAFDVARDTRVPNQYAANNFRVSANLQAREVQVAVVNDVAALNGVDLIAFDMRSAVVAYRRANVEAAVEGAYVVIAADRVAGANAGRMNGRIFRLGARHSEFDSNTALFPGIDASVVYELQPGNDFAPDPGANGVMGTGHDDITSIGLAGNTADAFLIGRSYTPANLDNIAAGIPLAPPLFEGAAMPIGVYTTFVKVN
jgi:type II secretory pathway pseudopilin PulG